MVMPLLVPIVNTSCEVLNTSCQLLKSLMDKSQSGSKQCDNPADGCGGKSQSVTLSKALSLEAKITF